MIYVAFILLVLYNVEILPLIYPQTKRQNVDGLGSWARSGFGGGGHATWHLVNCVLSAHCGDTLHTSHSSLQYIPSLH